MVCLIRVPSMRMLKRLPISPSYWRAQLAAQKRGDVVGLDGVDRRPGQVAVDRRQIRLPPENDVGGVLALVHAPVIGHAKIPVNRTEAAGHLVQPTVESLDLQAVGDLLRALPVGDIHERIVDQLEVDLALSQQAGQPAVPVEIDLQPARQPGRHPHVAQPQVFVDEIEVVVQALAVVRQQIGLAGVLVVPRLVGRAGFHRRQDAYQPRMRRRAWPASL